MPANGMAKKKKIRPITMYCPIFSLRGAEGVFLANLWKDWLPTKCDIASILSLLHCSIQITSADELHVISSAGATAKKKAGPQCLMTRVSGSNSSLDFGNPAIPVGPVAFRPPIARSLALSVVMDALSPFPLGQGHPLFKSFSATSGRNFRGNFEWQQQF